MPTIRTKILFCLQVLHVIPSFTALRTSASRFYRKLVFISIFETITTFRALHCFGLPPKEDKITKTLGKGAGLPLLKDKRPIIGKK